MAASSSSSKIEEQPPQHQLFINFRGADLRFEFVCYLVQALENDNINVFFDNFADKGEPLETLLTKIEESRIALVIISMRYTESKWCLSELAKIKECVEKGKLVAIPIFYKLDPDNVGLVSGQFGDSFRGLNELDKTKKKEWKKALKWIPNLIGITVHENSPESEIINAIVKGVKKALPSEGSRKASVDPSENNDTQTSSGGEKDKTFGIKQRLDELKEKLGLNKFRSQLGMIIGCLLLLFFVLQQIAYMSTPLIGEGGGAINRIAVNVPKMPKYIPAEGTENPRDRYTEFSTGNYGAKPESSSSDAKTNIDLLERTFTNSQMHGKVKPPKIQVFINFRGDELRKTFVGYLVDALRRSEINFYIDYQEPRGEDLNILFKRIEDSGIAIVVFSSRYTESKWCLEELVKIKERVHQGLLKVLPIFYKVTPTNVKRLKGDFGDHFRDKEYTYESDEPMIKRWKEAIVFVSHKFALTWDEKSSVSEVDFVETIVKEVLKMLQAISKVESGQYSRSVPALY